MPLPVLSHHQPSDADLVRLFHKTEARRLEHLAEPAELDCGTAYLNPSLPAVPEANSICDVALPQGASPQSAFDLVQSHFWSAGSSCAYWVMNPSSPSAAIEPMAEYLLSRGHVRREAHIMVLNRASTAGPADTPDLTVIPARAGYRHCQALFEEQERLSNQRGHVEAQMLHLDDPHWDAILMLKGSEPAGYGGVLAVGELGRIDGLYAGQRFSGQGVEKLLLGRIIDACARALFHHVMVRVPQSDTDAFQMYASAGFRCIGSIVAYHALG